MRFLNNAIAVRGGEAQHRRRTGRWAATPEELARMAGNGRLKCLERKLTLVVTRRQFACLDLC
jgi:hypothetical protein